MSVTTVQAARFLTGTCFLLLSAGALASPSGIDLGTCRKAAERMSGHCAQHEAGAEDCQAESQRAFEACWAHLLAPFTQDRAREERAAAIAAARNAKPHKQPPAQPAQSD